MAERVETDSTVDLQLPIDDSLELGEAAEFLESSDVFEDQFAVDENVPPASPRGDANHFDFAANSVDSTSATQGTPVSEVRPGFHSSSLSDRILPSQLGWSDRDFSGIRHQVPSVLGSLPAGRVTTRPDVARIDMSASGSARIGAAARPGSEEPTMDQIVQGGHGDAPLPCSY